MLDEIAKYTLEPSQTNKPDVSSCSDVTIYEASPTYPNIVKTCSQHISIAHLRALFIILYTSINGL